MCDRTKYKCQLDYATSSHSETRGNVVDDCEKCVWQSYQENIKFPSQISSCKNQLTKKNKKCKKKINKTRAVSRLVLSWAGSTLWRQLDAWRHQAHSFVRMRAGKENRGGKHRLLLSCGLKEVVSWRHETRWKRRKRWRFEARKKRNDASQFDCSLPTPPLANCNARNYSATACERESIVSDCNVL